MPTDKSDFDEKTTHFGYQEVPLSEKVKKVAGVFSSVAPKYDLMNDVISLGTHRVFKRMAMALSGVRAGHKVLDLAGGTGDFTKLFSPIVGSTGRIYLSDINYAMLEAGRERLIDDGIVGNVDIVQANGEFLPFPEDYFDCLTIGYGIRNFTNKPDALKEAKRVLKPGGRLLILEFSKPKSGLLSKAYDIYSSAWPTIGKVLANDSDSYNYLNESIRMHPDQDEFKAMIEEADFTEVKYHNLLGGISAIHVGVA